MKSNYFLLMLGSLLALLVFQGFQCASSEFTGAKVQLQQKNFSEAKRLLEIEVQKNPANEEAWYLLGALRADDGEYEGMNEAFNKALGFSNKYQDNIRSVRYGNWGQHINNGVQFLDRASSDSVEFYDKAVAEFRNAHRAWPDTSLTFRYIGYTYSNKGDLDGALEAFREAWAMGKDLESLKRIGRLHMVRADELKTAFETENAEPMDNLKKLLEIKKNMRKADVGMYIGQPSERKRGPRGTSRETWIYKDFNLELGVDGEKVTSVTFTNPYAPKIDSTNYFKAHESYGQAVNALETAREMDHRDKETLNLLLRAYVESDRISEATKVFRSAVEDEPDNKLNRYVLGVLLRTMGKYQEAIDEFQKAYELDPNYSDALFDLGATYYNWGVEILRAAEDKGIQTTEHKSMFKKALPYMEKVVEAKSDDASMWETLGTIYAQLDMQEEAIKAFDKADKIRQGQ